MYTPFLNLQLSFKLSGVFATSTNYHGSAYLPVNYTFSLSCMHERVPILPSHLSPTCPDGVSFAGLDSYRSCCWCMSWEKEGEEAIKMWSEAISLGGGGWNLLKIGRSPWQAWATLASWSHSETRSLTTPLLYRFYRAWIFSILSKGLTITSSSTGRAGGKGQWEVYNFTLKLLHPHCTHQFCSYIIR